MPYQQIPEDGPIRHYWGDAVRQLFIAAATVMMVGAPFYANFLPVQAPFIVLGVCTIVILAALTNPISQGIALLDAVVAGIGLAVYGAWGIVAYASSDYVALVLRLAIALVFLSAFYFSLKTVRAMALHQIRMPEEKPMPPPSAPTVLDQFSDEVEREEETREQRRERRRAAEEAVEDITKEAPEEPFKGEE